MNLAVVFSHPASEQAPNQLPSCVRSTARGTNQPTHRGAVMASVRASYHWAEGHSVNVQVWAEDSYPESIAVARVNAVEALSEAIAMLDDVADDDALYLPPTEADE